MTLSRIPSLQDQLNERRAQSKVAPERRAIMVQANEDLRASGMLDHIIRQGDAAPDFTLPDIDGKPVTLSEALEEGPVVLVFYRGTWCPYCNLTLRTYQQVLPQFEERGAQLIAVSPQTPDNSLTMAEKNALEFPVLSDVGNVVARAYGLVFTVSQAVRDVYEQINIDLVQANGDENYELPLPATYVIGQDGTVRYGFADADYVQRAEPANLLAALDEIE